MVYTEIDDISTQFLTTLPDVLGIMSDKVVLEAFHRYLGLEIPATRPFISRPHWIGRRGKEQYVDAYGDAVARA